MKKNIIAVMKKAFELWHSHVAIQSASFIVIKKAFSLLLLSSLKKIASFRVSCKLYTHILTESFTALQNNVKHFLLCYNMVCLKEFWPEPFNLKRVANIAVKLSNRCNPKSVLNEIDF